MTTHGRRTASEIISKHRTRNVYDLCDTYGVFVIEASMRKMLGYITDDEMGHYIIVNQKLPEFLKRFVIAHELGHYFMHPHDIGFFWIIKNTQFPIARLERHADDFALELLKISENVYMQIKKYIAQLRMQ